MILYLVQHGKSLSKDQDPDPGLSPEGIADTERIAGVAKGYGIQVAGIFHSEKKRARETAQIFQNALRPSLAMAERSGLKPLDDVAAVAAELSGLENCMLVGHLPFMSRLASHLVARSVDIPIFAFQNSGIVCLQKDEQDKWIIKWTLMPNIF